MLASFVQETIEGVEALEEALREEMEISRAKNASLEKAQTIIFRLTQEVRIRFLTFARMSSHRRL